MSCKKCRCDNMEKLSEGIKELNEMNNNWTFSSAGEEVNDGYDPEQWKIEVTKVDNGYIIKNKSENNVMVIEEEDGDIEGLANMLYYLANEIGSAYRVEINSLEHKHDYLKEDFKMMLEDVYKSFNDDDHDVTTETMEQLEDIFGKFSWRNKNVK